MVSYTEKSLDKKKAQNLCDLCENIRSEGKHFNKNYIHSILHEQ